MAEIPGSSERQRITLAHMRLKYDFWGELTGQDKPSQLLAQAIQRQGLNPHDYYYCGVDMYDDTPEGYREEAKEVVRRNKHGKTRSFVSSFINPEVLSWAYAFPGDVRDAGDPNHQVKNSNNPLFYALKPDSVGRPTTMGGLVLAYDKSMVEYDFSSSRIQPKEGYKLGDAIRVVVAVHWEQE